MARKSKAAAQPVTVNPEKIVRGLTTVFQGFSIMFDGMAEQMQLMQDMTDQLGIPGAAPHGEKMNVDAGAEINTEEPVKEETMEDVPAEAVTTGTESTEVAVTTEETDTPPWEEETAPEDDSSTVSSQTAASPAVTITQDDIVKVVVAKIKLNRNNNAKIGKLLGAYGVRLLSELPAEKYEAFLSDISQL